MSIILMVIMVALTGSEQEEPAYVLEHPGIGFGWLASEFSPPVEGNLAPEAGALASGPNTTGIEYHLFYWQEDLAEDTRKDSWLEERFMSMVSPDLAPMILLGEVTYTEGSMNSPYRLDSSIGLVSQMNFNIVSESGSVIGVGKACAVFRNDYSTLIYTLSPVSVQGNVREDLDAMVSLMYLVE